eukprot:8957704-Pyramimonas_sp.AAC.1
MYSSSSSLAPPHTRNWGRRGALGPWSQRGTAARPPPPRTSSPTAARASPPGSRSPTRSADPARGRSRP